MILANVDTEAMREIRVYFYKQAMLNRDSARICLNHGQKSSATIYDASANLHMKRVQALNDLFPAGDDVDSDWRKSMEPK